MKPADSAMMAAIAVLVLGSSAGCSSTSRPSGCDVSFADVQPAGQTLVTTPFHDGRANVLYWTPKLNHLDVLGGDLSNQPSRAFELELAGKPIADGATIALSADLSVLPAPPKLELATANADKLRASGGTLHFTTANDSRLVFSVEGATMIALDANGKAKTDGPSLTMSMSCAFDVQAK